MVCDSAPPLGLSPQRPRRRKKGRNIHVGRKLPYKEQKLEKEREVRKNSKKFNKNSTSSVQGKKKNWNVYPKGWGLRIPSIPPTQHTSTTPPVPLPILLNPDSTYSRLHALGTYCAWWKATTSH